MGNGGEALPLPEDRVDVRALLAGLRPSGYTSTERVDALSRLAPALGRATAAAAQSSPERARSVMAALGLGRSSGGVPELVGEGGGELTRELCAARRARSRASSAPSSCRPTSRCRAIRPATSAPWPSSSWAAAASLTAQDAVVAALGDREPGVRRAALLALPVGHAAAISAVAQKLGSEEDWALRSSAAEALGRIAAGSGDAKATTALTAAATSDAYALVRESAALALSSVNPEKARAVLERLARSDEEPAVQRTARKLLSGAK